MEPIILVIKWGTLRLAEAKEFKNSKWEDIELRQYTISTVDNKYKIVDLDKSEVKPIIRSILWQIGLYPELKIVSMTRWIVSIVGVICLFTLLIATRANSEKSYSEGQKVIIDTIKKTCSTWLTNRTIDIKGIEKPEDKSVKIFWK